MNVSRSTIEQAFQDIILSAAYRAPWPIGPNQLDKEKVNARLAGQPSKSPSHRLARAAWRLAGALTPLIPTPPPPPTYKKVAPRAAYAEGGSDARFSLTTDGVTLRAGVFRRADGKYSDESGAVYTDLDGLDESGIRAGAPAVVGAKQIDGRNLWDLPLTGDPTKNTGSWSI